jgi:glycosyltransferase involved in cell wall biosynthesis
MVMQIAYVTRYDVLDSSTWPKPLTGICSAGYYLAKNLENQVIRLHYIGPLEDKYKFITQLKTKFYNKYSKKFYEIWSEPLVVQDYADQISRKLATFNSDIVLCPESFIPLAYLNCKQPIVVWTDTSIAGLIDFYPWFSNLCNETKRNIYAMEKAALDRCNLVVFASDWAAQIAIETYEIAPSKIRVVPWGANLEDNRTDEDVKKIVEFRAATPCKLLFIGIDWFRKGGDIAVEVAKELNKMGLTTELLVVGCEPITNEPLPSFVKTLGFVNKSTKEGINQMNKLFCESHFFIMPSRAESYGHVLCEANSFGVPCLATEIGGIPTIIKSGLNGKHFSLGANISEYCTYIASLMTNYSEYKKLAHSSFNEYQSRLNWVVAGQTVKHLIRGLV